MIALSRNPNVKHGTAATKPSFINCDLEGGSVARLADTASGARGAPLFVVAGACPSVFAGMQAVVYAAMRPAGAPPPARASLPARKASAA